MKEMEIKGLSLAQTIAHVEDFHNAFGIKNNDSPVANIDRNDYELRYRLMREENEEYLEAAKEGDLIEIADAKS